MMKFDLDTGWRDVKSLASENRTLLTSIAGMFIFIPLAVALILLPTIAEVPQPPEGADMEAVSKAMSAFYAETWWVLIIVLAIVTTGQLAMLALLERKPNPTVGEAIGVAGKALFPALLTLFMQSLLVQLAMGLIVAATTLTGLGALGFFGVIAALVLGWYLTTRFSLILPIIAGEGQLNPIAVLGSSWRRTKGNGGRLLAFYLLVGLALAICAFVALMLSAVVLALFGQAIAQTGGVIVAAFLIAIGVAIFTLVLAAAHRQLLRLERGRNPAA
ncbi:hypothetical protein [Erythrobacter sp. SD-21]|uniref:hypothetical protein n=1 Tax=Erythrobacter sp. SD-21 TaxID=161528 RepID=UPI000153F4FA|nr:hypothetical protein [Erythrobacter sp. SD-21]EDL47867.1 hypothetical protein ED21_22198 [Erythrobacter sp. SD-21]